MTKSLTKKIDQLNNFVGRISALLVIILVFLISYDVTMRYLFHNGSIALQELEWHLFSLIFLLGAAYTLQHDEHVRVDLIYRSRFMNDKHRAWIDIIGGICLLIPFCLLIIINTWPFLSNSYTINETSPDPGGLPYRWILKASIIVGFSLLLLQGVAEILKNINKLRQDQS